jgi:hypothetical protein
MLSGAVGPVRADGLLQLPDSACPGDGRRYGAYDGPLSRQCVAAPEASDLGADFATPPCRALLCEDFESGALAPIWKQVVGQGGGLIAVDGVRAHSGRYALHVQASATGTATSVGGHIEETQTFPQLQGGLFARVCLPSGGFV